MKNSFLKKIKKIFQDFLEKRAWDEMTIQQRMFHVIAIIGSAVAFLSLVENLFVTDSVFLQIIMIVMFVVFIGALWISIYFRRIKVATICVCLFLNLLVFPCVFLFQNGMNSGAPLWFLLGFFYIFLMFSGWQLFLFLGIAVVTDIATYGLAYYYHDFFDKSFTMADAYLDSLYSMLAVGVAVGILLRMEMNLYEKEQKTARQRATELEAALNSRNNLFAGMSHEIRTPINTIMGLNELIKRSNPSDEVAEYVADIENSSAMLLTLVNDILDYSRLGINKLEIIPEQYSCHKLYSDLYDMISVQAKKKNLSLTFTVDRILPSELYGDAKRINQVLTNLLTNAVKYTEKGSVHLEVTGEAVQEDEYRLQIRVSDTGIGIKKEDIANLYDRFSRFDEKKNKTVEGSGLGLAIVKELLDLMDGTIHVDSIYMAGTTFTVTIPQKIVNMTPVGYIPFGEKVKRELVHYHQKFEAPEAKILIVDDNRMNTTVTSRLLASTRMQIFSATSGKECLEITRRKFFHLILMDYMMPDMNGHETLMALRTQDNGLCKETPVIALTATSREDSENLPGNQDFSGYLEKPIKSEELESAILSFLPADIVEYKAESQSTAESDNGTPVMNKKKKVRITTDCVSDLPQSYIEKYDIHVQNLYIHTESGRFLDTIEIDSDNMSQYIRDSVENIHADSCSIAEFESFFAQNLTEAFDVVHISMAANSGRTYSRALSAAQGFDHVHVIDSGHISCGQALLVLEAARLAELGKSVEEILIAIDDAKRRVQSGFLMPFPSLFQKRGYTHSVIPKITKAFHLRPILRMRKSVISVVGFMLGDDNEKLWRKYVNYRLRGERYIDSGVVMVSFAGCSAEKRKVVLKEIQNRYDFNVIVESKSSFSSACNCGEGTFGFAFFEKDSQ